MNVRCIEPSQYQRATWKNGLGFTDQIAIHPPGADLRRGDFLWRISSARIERSSPFSAFPEHDRILVVLEGEGVRLSHDFGEGGESDRVDLPALEPYEFPGDIATHCELMGGPIRDLSIFINKGRVSAMADVHRIDEEVHLEPQAATIFVHVVRGAIELNGLRAGQGATLRADLGANDNSQLLTLKAIEAGSVAVVIQLAS